MPDSIMYHEGNRRLQGRFDSRRISDRLEEKQTRTEFSDNEKKFIENASYFFLATADAEGRPDCSFKGGMPGFVRVTGAAELAFPDYDGNGMFKSLGMSWSIRMSAFCLSPCMGRGDVCASMASPPCVRTMLCSARLSARN